MAVATHRIPQAHESLRQLKPYQPGKPISELKRELGLPHIIKLASNENPLGPSPAALAVIEKEAKHLALYPDGAVYDLKYALSKKLQVKPEQLILGNGSDAIFTYILQAFVEKGDEVIVSQYAFAAYKIAATAAQATVIEVPAQEWGHNLEAFIKSITLKTKVIFIANPNNPTGTHLTHDALAHFLQTVPSHILVVLDEAYYEYACTNEQYPCSMEWLQQYPNLLITRTFSKIHGLAGLRVGYGIAHPTLCDLLNRVRLPFNISSLGQYAAIAALEDESHVEKGLALNKKVKAHLESALQSRNIPYLPSLANFVTIQLTEKAQPVFEALLQKGIIVRSLGGYNMPNHLRVSVGTEEENNQFLAAFDAVLKG